MFQIPKNLVDRAITKDTLHRSGKRLLKEIAQAVGIPESDYALRSNKGGDGVMGEVVAHSDSLYLMLHVGSGSTLKVLYRTCTSKKDFSGGMNMYVNVSDLVSSTASERFIEKLKNLGNLSKRQNASHAA
ncbi:hypothetical protein [Pseudomonas abietaniphila]|uniref:Uncharacterized protein n=1 Tax=Pseudomonas abietaniphila TaxID=89065 RepID=A0A1G8QV80_9PSED|nr:hypothetical protein [Pseudomonas abietaniphila]SDJ08543.1 hypothetical protein SAMN05216605_12173 [Pseudomonas abietaniphila]